MKIIINNVTGWLFKPGDAIDLSEKIRKAIDLDGLERKNLASKAIERTLLNFNNDTMCFKTLEIYSDLINRNSKNEK